jgi:hypothetical protein
VRFLTDRAGVVAVEFALAAPLLILLLLGLVNVGTVYFHRLQLTAAVKAGADLALYTDGQALALARIEEEVLAVAPAAPGERALETALQCRCAGNVPSACGVICVDGLLAGGYVAIRLVDTVPFPIPVPYLGSSVPVTVDATVRVF